MVVVTEPCVVASLSRVAAIAVGTYSSCAQKDTGEVYCWGRVREGRGWTERPRSEPLAPGARLFQDSTMQHIGAISGDEVLMWWTDHFETEYSLVGLFGAKTSVDYLRIERSTRQGPGHVFAARASAEPVYAQTRNFMSTRGIHRSTLRGARDFALCHDQVCTVDTRGAVACGSIDRSRAAGLREIPLPTATAHIACSLNEVCALLVDGTVWCWTHQKTDDMMYPLDPTEIPLRHKAAGLTLAFMSACTWSGDGTVECWADSGPWVDPRTHAALQRGRANAPQTVTGIFGAVQVALSSTHACALHGSGEVSCWGDDSHGQCGVDPGTPQSASEEAPSP